MNISTYELLIPGVTREIEWRANNAHHGLPARPARWSPTRWLRARRAAIAGHAPTDSRNQRPIL